VDRAKNLLMYRCRVAEPFDPTRFDELARCPTCGQRMREEPQVAERVGLYYTCPEHGRFRYSWDDDRLEPVDALE
jgi:hypothetical protein